MLTQRSTENRRKEERKGKKMGYILIDKEGSIAAKLFGLPILAMEGFRISYKNDESILGKVDYGIRHFDRIGGSGKLYSNPGDYVGGSKFYYHFSVVGSDPVVVGEIIEEIEHLLGAKNVSQKGTKKKKVKLR